MHNTSMQCEMIWKLILQKYNFLRPWSSFSQQDHWKITHCYCKSTCYSGGGLLERCQNCLDRNSGWVCPKVLEVQKFTTEFTAKHRCEVQHKFKVLSRKFLNMSKIDSITAVLLTLSLQFFQILNKAAFVSIYAAVSLILTLPRLVRTPTYRVPPDQTKTTTT